MGTQAALFGQAAAPTGARPVYATPQPCGACPAVAMIYGRMYDGDAPIDLCAACAADIVRIIRAAGLHVPAGFEWVV